MALLVPVLLLAALALFDLAFRPSFRRMALRNVVRRKNEALLVVAGSMLGTAVITAAFLVGATFDASVRDLGRTTLGPTDEWVRVDDVDRRAGVEAALRVRPVPGTDGMLPIVSTDVAVASTGAGRRADPSTLVIEADLDAARAYGDDESSTGLADAGGTPAEGETVLNEELADELDVAVGDTVEMFAYGQSVELEVRTIVPEVGLAGTASLFVEPGTVVGMAERSTLAAAEPPSGGVLVSNTGGVYDGAGRTDAVTGELERRLDGLEGVSVETPKQDVLDQAKASGDGMSQLFTSIGSFSVLAGILLLINLFVMLAEERKSEMGMLRAVGLKRNHLMRVFGLEGVLYALAAAALGVAVGVAVARAIVGVVERIFAIGEADDFHLIFTAAPGDLLLGGLIGLLISLVTVHLTSFRISRLNVIAAIRDLPDPGRSSRRWLRLVSSAVGVVLGGLVFASGVSAEAAIPAMAGPAIVCFSAIPLLTRLLPRRVAVVTLAAAALVWAVAIFSVLPDVMSEADISVFVVQGVVMVAAAVTILAQLDGMWTVFSSLLMRTAGGLPARLGLAYPLARKFRTGMLLGMYALVMFTLTFMAVVSGIFAAQEDSFVAGAEVGTSIVVDTNPANPVTAGAIEEQDGVVAAVPLVSGPTDFTAGPVQDGKADETQPWPITGFDERFLERGTPKLTERMAGYDSDRAAFEAVLADSDLAIVPTFFLSGGEGGRPDGRPLDVGDRFTAIDVATGDTHELTVAGQIEYEVWANQRTNGALVARPVAEQMLAERAVESRFYVAVAPGADAERVAARLQGALLANGVEAETFRRQVREDIRAQIGFLRLMQGYLGLGLLIGIAGLGVVMVRAVRERRRQIGMLRAMGFSSAVVRRAFLFEAAFVAVQGIVVGVGLGLLTAYQVLTNSDAFGEDRLPFAVPWGGLLVITVIPLVVSLLATAAPADHASRIRPAAALRLAD